MTELIVDPAPVAALAALFDIECPAIGDPLPALWHWAALARWPGSSLLGPDGHPRRGAELPPIALPRRMFAGGEVEFARPLPVGAAVRRETRVLSMVEKRGRSGPLTVVTVETRLYPADDPNDAPAALVERQDLVYREAPSAAPAAAAAAVRSDPVGAPLRRAGDGWAFDTDPTVLMRFSAATANAHRIHYDHPYATGVEGYPDLVVHGPLMTLVLAEAHRRGGGPAPALLRHRNLAPLFCGRPAVVAIDDTPAGRRLSLRSGPDDSPTVHTALQVDPTNERHADA